MNILFLDSPSFGKEDMKRAFVNAGYKVISFYNDYVYNRIDKEFDLWLEQYLKRDNIAFLFSFNYFPSLSNGCQRHGIPYVAYVYDSPLSALYSTTLLNSCNHVFLFDGAVYEEFKQGGINTVHYMPLAVNVSRLDGIKVPKEALDTVSSEVSFVGSLYNEKHNLFDKLDGLDKYTKGYLDALMDAQMCIWGYYFVDEMLTPEIVDAMSKCAPYTIQPDGVETLQYIYSRYFIARRITALERQRLLKRVSKQYKLKLYTHRKPDNIPEADYIGAIDWEESMPAVFRHSRINLNISLRSIRTGIPLRAFDIMGAGGFLLTNYQSDLFKHFTAGQDFVYYESEDDMMNKIEYYMSHENERKEIAANGHEAVKQSHTYEHRVKEMLDIIRQTS